ncbi:MAG: hydrogenase maturation protease [Candidatus Korobacteraceae bacterium]
MPETLIIGYGNPLRGDDAAGCRAAHELERLFHNDPDVEVIASQQLTPEMAEDVARSRFILFIDAALGDRPGAIRRMRVSPEPGPAGFTHHLTPSSLLSAAEQLYGDAPTAMVVTLAGWSFELGDKLSPGASRRLPELVRLAQGIVKNHRQAAHAESLAHTT